MQKQKFKKIFHILQQSVLSEEQFERNFFTNEFTNIYEELMSYMEELDFV